MLMGVLSVLVLIVGVGSLVIAGKQLSEARRLNRQSLSATRVNRAVDGYMQLYNSNQASGIHALLRSDVSGLSAEELDEITQRITAATGRDPFGEGHTEGGIRTFLNQHGIAAIDFINYVTRHRVSPRDLSFEKLQEIATGIKKPGGDTR